VIEALRKQRYGAIIVVGAASLAVMVLAWQVPGEPTLAIGAAILLVALGLATAAPTLLLAAVFATCFAYWRVGPDALNMSLGDAVTLIALLAAIPFVPWHSRPLRQILAGLFAYLALLFVSVMGHPTQVAIVEWLHRAVLFGGAILIGAAVAHRHQVALALKALVYASSVVAVAAIVDAVTTGFGPAFPFGIHKNAAGPLFAMVAMLMIAAPWRIGIRPSMLRHLRFLIIVGLLATQSRGALLALVAGIALYAMRHRSARQRAPIFFLTVTLALIAVSVVTLKAQNEDNPNFNGVALRSSTIDDAINRVWAAHPLVGGGLKYFRATGAQAGGAEQIFVAELAEAGIIGLIGLIVLLTNTSRVLFARRDPLGEAAFLVFVVEVLYALTAIFWIAGTLTLPMLLVGLAVGESTGAPDSPGQGQVAASEHE
jgi:hypothetical protein